MLRELLDLEEGLSEWEIQFIESLFKQNRGGRVFTETQRAKLQQIYDDKAA
jgi:hypothetical protein